MSVILGSPVFPGTATLLPLRGDELLESLILHGGDALLAEIVLDLVIVNSIHADGPPLLDSLLQEISIKSFNMDAALIAERNAFKRKAMAVPVLENKKVCLPKKEEPPKRPSSSSSKKSSKPSSATEKLDIARLKGMGGTSQYKFSVLARIVRHMKSRHMEGEDHPLTLEEILDETSQLDVGGKTRQWLEAEALNNNPKIKVGFFF